MAVEHVGKHDEEVYKLEYWVKKYFDIKVVMNHWMIFLIWLFNCSS